MDSWVTFGNNCSFLATTLEYFQNYLHIGLQHQSLLVVGLSLQLGYGAYLHSSTGHFV